MAQRHPDRRTCNFVGVEQHGGVDVGRAPDVFVRECLEVTVDRARSAVDAPA
jgi:hypothetical protein